MNNSFRYSCDNKRYHTLNYYNTQKYGRKVMKAVIDCGMTCPNIDGTKGYGGCIFCDSGSGYFTHPELSISGQMNAELSRLHSKLGEDVRVIAYFQSNTNTYAPTDELSKIWDEVLRFPEVCGVSVGTRADCLSEDILELLDGLNRKTDLTVELGMQTIHPKTLELINSCCSREEFSAGYYSLKEHGIRVCLHIIDGLPFETPEMMIETAKAAANMNADAIKLQMLHVIKGTKLAEMYANNEFRLLSKDEYINIIIRQLEVLPETTVIERITGDGDKSKLIAPRWSADKIAVLGGIDKRLAELDTWQGRSYKRIDTIE